MRHAAVMDEELPVGFSATRAPRKEYDTAVAMPTSPSLSRRPSGGCCRGRAMMTRQEQSTLTPTGSSCKLAPRVTRDGGRKTDGCRA